MAVRLLQTISIMVKNNRTMNFIAFCLGFVLILLLIQAGGVLRGNRIVFPDLREIGKAMIHLLSRGETYAQIGTTMLHLIEALVLSMTVGVFAGMVSGLSGFVRSALRPFMILIRSIPMIVLVIVLMVLFPYNRVPVVSGTLILIPVISEAVSEGCRSIDPELLDVYRINSGFNLSILFRVYLPLISGYLKQSFFNAAGMGLKVVVSAEFLVQTKNSLGKAVYSSSYFLEYAEIYAYALIMILLVLIITELPLYLFRSAGKRRRIQLSR